MNRCGQRRAGRFDFFVLSDSGDSDICSAELDAWASLCRTIGGFGRIFYRHRRRRVKRKSGNIDDFCRRWGANYSYMIVLDADSVMSGSCLTTLVRLMEANPTAGIVQTAPRAAGRDTLYARIQQFSTRVTVPCSPPACITGSWASHYWGTTPSSACSRSWSIVRWRRCREGRWPARFSRMICRSVADAPRRLVGVDRL